MLEQFEYKKKWVVVDTYSVGHGWLWTYQIDGGPPREERDRPLRNEELVLQNGVREAKAEIDRMG
jgi:hypothetical protein